MENTEYICFISPCGGSGCSSAAFSLARIARKIFRRRVLVLSLDTLAEKMLPPSAAGRKSESLPAHIVQSLGRGVRADLVSDDYSVSYITGKGYLNPLRSLTAEELNVFLEELSGSELFDLVVLDVPYQSGISETVAMCCEKIVAVYGYLPSQISLGAAFRRRLETVSKDLVHKPKIYSFSPMEDSDSFSGGEADIHDQYGAEVRELADQLLPPV